MKSVPFLKYDKFSYHHAKDANVSTMGNLFVRHDHAMYELYYFISGEGHFLVENTLYELRSGDLILLRPGEFHNFIATSPYDYERYCLHFDGSLMADYPQLLAPFHNREPGTHNVIRPDSELFLDIFRHLEIAASTEEEPRRLLSVFLLGELLTYVSLFADDRIRLVGGEHMPPLVEKMMQYIHEHLTEPLSLDALAEHVFMTKSHISRVFKSTMGISPMEYIIRKRVQLARQYLQEGMGAEETATRCGFGDYSSFYRAYRRIMGQSPRQKERGE